VWCNPHRYYLLYDSAGAPKAPSALSELPALQEEMVILFWRFLAPIAVASPAKPQHLRLSVPWAAEASQFYLYMYPGRLRPVLFFLTNRPHSSTIAADGH
jgi:hypothetical protein